MGQRTSPVGAVYLERPRVNAIFAKALRARANVSVRAGAGYGKTCAASAFLKRLGNARTLWIQLSERDNIAARFWEKFTRAIAAYNTRMAARLEDLGFPGTDSEFRKYRRILKEERLPDRKLVVVFDECHLICNPELEKSLRKVLWFPPQPNRAIILMSQTDTESERQRLPRGIPAVSITEVDLRFTKEETAAYFQALGLELPEEDLARIHAGTQGWALALALLGMVLRKDPSRTKQALAAMKSSVFKLMDSEVFQAASEGLRRFLIRLSLIDNLSAGLIRRLADDPALIGELDRVGFGVRRDARMDAWTLHPLLREHLFRKRGLLTGEEMRGTYIRAAAWYNENGYKSDAVYYYAKTGEYAQIVRLVFDSIPQVPPMLARMIAKVFDLVPPETALAVPLFAAMHPYLKLRLGRLDEAFDLACRYRDKFEAMPETPFNNRVLAEIYSVLGYTRLMAAVVTDDYDFDAYYKRQDEYYSRAPYPVSGAITSMDAGPWISMVGTDRQGAMEEYIDALGRAEPHVAHAMGGAMSGMHVLARGELCFYRGELAEADRLVAEALEVSGRFHQHDVRNRALFYLLRISCAQGDSAKAERAMLELEQQLDEPDYNIRVTTFDIVACAYYLMVDQHQSIAGWLKADFEGGTLVDFVAGFKMMVQARYHFRSGSYRKLLAFIRGRRRPGMILFGALEWLALEAVCQMRLKQVDAALATLRRGYALALSNRIVMPLIELGEDARSLVEAALRDGTGGIPRPWLEEVGDRAAAYAANRRRFVEEYEDAHHAENQVVLTPREKDVLRDLSFDLSKVEIAASRNISIHAVRNAVNSLKAKFGTSDVAALLGRAAKKNLL